MLAGSRPDTAGDFIPPDSGKITWNDNIRIGWLSQDPQMDPDHTVLEQLFASQTETARAVRDYEAALARHDDQALPAVCVKLR